MENKKERSREIKEKERDFLLFWLGEEKEKS